MIVVNALDPEICVCVVTARCSRWEIECITAVIVFAILRLSRGN